MFWSTGTVSTECAKQLLSHAFCPAVLWAVLGLPGYVTLSNHLPDINDEYNWKMNGLNL